MTVRITDIEAIHQNVEGAVANCGDELLAEADPEDAARCLTALYLTREALDVQIEIAQRRLQGCEVERVYAPEHESFLFEAMEDGDNVVYVPTDELVGLAGRVQNDTFEAEVE